MFKKEIATHRIILANGVISNLFRNRLRCFPPLRFLVFPSQTIYFTTNAVLEVGLPLWTGCSQPPWEGGGSVCSCKFNCFENK